MFKIIKYCRTHRSFSYGVFSQYTSFFRWFIALMLFLLITPLLHDTDTTLVLSVIPYPVPRIRQFSFYWRHSNSQKHFQRNLPLSFFLYNEMDTYYIYFVISIIWPAYPLFWHVIAQSSKSPISSRENNKVLTLIMTTFNGCFPAFVFSLSVS